MRWVIVQPLLVYTARVQDISSALSEYEEMCSEASDAGIDIVSKDYSYNWDYIQSCFFALTILTTIGL